VDDVDRLGAEAGGVIVKDRVVDLRALAQERT
jgi:hypothetical protein